MKKYIYYYLIFLLLAIFKTETFGVFLNLANEGVNIVDKKYILAEKYAKLRSLSDYFNTDGLAEIKYYYPEYSQKINYLDNLTNNINTIYFNKVLTYKPYWFIKSTVQIFNFSNPIFNKKDLLGNHFGTYNIAVDSNYRIYDFSDSYSSRTVYDGFVENNILANAKLSQKDFIKLTDLIIKLIYTNDNYPELSDTLTDLKIKELGLICHQTKKTNIVKGYFPNIDSKVVFTFEKNGNLIKAKTFNSMQ